MVFGENNVINLYCILFILFYFTYGNQVIILRRKECNIFKWLLTAHYLIGLLSYLDCSVLVNYCNYLLLLVGLFVWLCTNCYLLLCLAFVHQLSFSSILNQKCLHL